MARNLPSQEERTTVYQPDASIQTEETVPARARTGWTRHRFTRVVAVPWAFLLPILLLHALVVLIPALQGVYYSFTEWSGIGQAQYVGLENFRRLLFEDEAYGSALRNNLIWLTFFATVPFG